MIKKMSVLLSLVVWSCQLAFSQNLPAPGKGKALVIFTRPALDAPIIKFEYFDGQQFLGKMGIGSYISYECEPGKHIFWAKSENRDFIEAELESGKTYIIETKVTTGIIKARIQLIPYNPNAKGAAKFKERLLKRIAKCEEVRFVVGDKVDAENETTIDKGMAEYEKLKKKGKKMELLKADMHL